MIPLYQHCLQISMHISCRGLDCHLNLSNPDNEGWMNAKIQIKVPSFEGSFSFNIEIAEWKAFAEVLRELESTIGKKRDVSWGNMEDNISFQFTLHARGALEGTYRFSSDSLGLGPTLSGQFEADQTFLRIWALSAEKVLQNVH